MPRSEVCPIEDNLNISCEAYGIFRIILGYSIIKANSKEAISCEVTRETLVPGSSGRLVLEIVLLSTIIILLLSCSTSHQLGSCKL